LELDLNPDTKPAWRSKINWTAVIMASFSLLTALNIDVDPQVREAILTLLPVVGGGLIVIFRTWFTSRHVTV
jgi:hypothetical protein